MASDFAKVSSGDRLRVPAATWNEFLRLLDRPHDVRSGAAAASRETVLVRNDCGAARAQFEILGLDVPVVLPTNNEVEFKSQIIFSGVAPDADDHYKKFAVLQEPIADGAIGRATITGLAITQVTATGTTKEYARVVSAAYQLEHTDHGPAKILWAEAAGAERWAILDLGGEPTKTEVVEITGAAVAGVYPATIQKWNGTSWDDGEAVDVIEINGANLSGWSGGVYDWGED